MLMVSFCDCYCSTLPQVTGSKWPRVGGWCDPKSLRPCCSDYLHGTCVGSAENATCKCPKWVLPMCGPVDLLFSVLNVVFKIYSSKYTVYKYTKKYFILQPNILEMPRNSGFKKAIYQILCTLEGFTVGPSGQTRGVQLEVDRPLGAGA